MTYKGYTIEAEVRTYENWAVKDDGTLGEFNYPYLNSVEDDDIKYAVVDKDDLVQIWVDTFEEAKEFIDKEAQK